MKSILIVAGQLQIGGAEKVARDIALFADHTKYEFHYIVFGDKVGVYEAQLENIGCKIIHIPEPADGYFAYVRRLKSLMQENHYCAVHAHTMFNCGWIMLVAKRMGVPTRISHSHSALCDGNSAVKTVYEWLMRFLILHCSTDLVACGVAAGQRLFGKRAYQRDGKLILNGIDVQEFSYNLQKRDTIRCQLDIQKHFVLGHVGHLAEVKNQAFLLDLMPLILEKRAETILLLLGEGKDRAMLEQKVHDMQLDEHVIMTGNVSNVADYLSAMDVFVFPSLYEGLPLSILEVQANGLPCVISDSVPEDVFVTDLLHPLSLKVPKEQWVEAILNVQRKNSGAYNQMMLQSDYAVKNAMAKIYQIYENGKGPDKIRS